MTHLKQRLKTFGQSSGLLALAILGVSASAQAATLRVDADAPAVVEDGLAWDTAYTDLTAALAAANGGDEIWVAQGTYYPDSSLGRSGSFVVPSDVALYGGFRGAERTLDDRKGLFSTTILSGDVNQTPADPSDNVYHVVYLVGSGMHRIDGLTIESGNADGSFVYDEDVGGGIYAVDTNLDLVNCIVRRNSSLKGAGLYFYGGYNAGGLRIYRTRFSQNRAEEMGGGAFLYDLTGPRGIFGEEGGGEAEGPSWIFNSTFDRNVAGSNTWPTTQNGGGGLWVGRRDARLEVFNSVFFGNRVMGQGAAVFLTGLGDSTAWGNLTVTGNRVLGSNDPTGGGGGFFVEPGNDNSLIYNSIVWNNTGYISPSDIVGPGTLAGGALDYEAIKVQYSNVRYSLLDKNHPGPGNINADPGFANPRRHFALKSGSPSIDAGNDALLPLDYPDMDEDGRANQLWMWEVASRDFRVTNLREVDDPSTPNTGSGDPVATDTVIVDMGAYETPSSLGWK